jgi:hypothetical protein
MTFTAAARACAMTRAVPRVLAIPASSTINTIWPEPKPSSFITRASSRDGTPEKARKLRAFFGGVVGGTRARNPC